MEIKNISSTERIDAPSSDWHSATLAKLASKITVGIASAATHAYRTKGVALLRNQNIKRGFLDDSEVLFISDSFERTFAEKRLKKDDLITVRTGYPGMTCVVPDKYEGAQSFTTLITRPKTDVINSNYLNYYINSESGQKFFEANQIGGAQKNINAGTLKTMRVVYPINKSEQTAIATALSDTDALIAGLEKLIAKKRDVKQGTLQELMKPKKGWHSITIGHALEKIVGGGTPSRANPGYWGKEIPWVTVKDFATFDPRHTQEYITKEGLRNSASNLVPKNTLITSTRMALGKTVLYDVDVSINQDLKALFPRNSIHAIFLKYWFEINQQNIVALGSGSTVMGITLQELKRMPFFHPNIEEQKEIADKLSIIDNEIIKLDIKVNKIRLLKNSMMQSLLTGKIRLV